MIPSTQPALLADLVHALDGRSVRKLVSFNRHGAGTTSHG